MHADHAFCPLDRGRDSGHEQRGGVRCEHAAFGDHIRRQLDEQLPLELEPLRRGLDHQLAGTQVLEAWSRLQPVSRVICLLWGQPLAFHPSLQLGDDVLGSPLERFWNGIVQQRSGAGQAGQLSDPGAHGAGAGDADRPRRRSGCHVSALMPVTARPMISCWIWDVPS